MIPGLGMVNGHTNGGDVTPKYDASARSADGAGKDAAKALPPTSDPSTTAAASSSASASANAASTSSGYPAPIGPPR